MNFTGFTDEAERDLVAEIKVKKELQRKNLSLCGIDGVNVHEVAEDTFNRAMIDI